MTRRTRVLLVTDLTYPAQGRRYGDEDVDLAARLRRHVDLALCHPADAAALMAAYDVVLVRNSGPVIHHREVHDDFAAQALATGTKVLTELTAKGDMRGKAYLLDLHAAGYPVIPTVTALADVPTLPEVAAYVAKPLHGADSVGLRFVGRDELDGLDWTDLLVQPRIDLVHEVSFYFVGRRLHYALVAPDPARRWVLEPHEPTAADRAFAQRFVDWNAVDLGVQRVDACRTRTGELLLVELEDLNPYLSLDRVAPEVRDAFLADLVTSIETLAAAPTVSP